MMAWTAYLTVSLVWGSYFFAIALAIESFNPFGLVACRYLAGGVLALALGRALGEAAPQKRDLPHLMLQGFLLLTVATALLAWGERTVSSGATAILCSTPPLFYAIMGGERLDRRAWLGLVLGLAGVAILILPGSHGRTSNLLGIAGILLAAFLWAYGTLHGRRHVLGVGLFGQVGVQMLTGGAVGLLLVPFTGGFLHAPVTWTSGLAVAGMVIFLDLAGYSSFVYISKVWPPTKMSTYVYINPLVAVLLGCLLIGEKFTGAMVLGMAVVLLGVALLQLPRRAPALPD